MISFRRKALDAKRDDRFGARFACEQHSIIKRQPRAVNLRFVRAGKTRSKALANGGKTEHGGRQTKFRRTEDRTESAAKFGERPFAVQHCEQKQSGIKSIVAKARFAEEVVAAGIQTQNRITRKNTRPHESVAASFEQRISASGDHLAA